LQVKVQAAEEYYARMVADLIRLFFPQFKLLSDGTGNSAKADDLAAPGHSDSKSASSVSPMTDETEKPEEPKDTEAPEALLQILESSGEGEAEPGLIVGPAAG